MSDPKKHYVGPSKDHEAPTEHIEPMEVDDEAPVEYQGAYAEDDEDREQGYEVGFGKPPKDGQFKPGTSGNPLGRPRGSKGFLTRLHEITRGPVHVTENGLTKTMPLMEAIIHKEAHRALNDSRAAKELFRLVMLFESIEQPGAQKFVSHPAETATIKNLLKRIQEMKLPDLSEKD